MNKWIALCLVLLAAPAYAADEIVLTPPQLENLGVTLAVPEPAGTAAGSALPAQVVLPPDHEHLLSAPQGGRIEAALVAVGDPVQAGQVLARIHSPGFLGLQRGFLQADAELALARSERDRDGALFKEGIIAARRWHATRSRYDTAAAARAEAAQALELAGMAPADVATLARDRRLSATLALRAPAAGTVLERLAMAGQRVDAGAPVYRLADLSTLWLEIQAPAAVADGLAPGAGLAVAGSDARGRLLAVGRQVNAVTQNVTLRAEVTVGADRLRPGQFLQVHLEQAAGSGAFRVPAAAVIHQGDGDYVFVRTAKGFRAQAVTVLRREPAAVVIGAGLAGGEQVATSGLAALKAAWNGMGGE